MFESQLFFLDLTLIGVFIVGGNQNGWFLLYVTTFLVHKLNYIVPFLIHQEFSAEIIDHPIFIQGIKVKIIEDFNIILYANSYKFSLNSNCNKK